MIDQLATPTVCSRPSAADHFCPEAAILMTASLWNLPDSLRVQSGRTTVAERASCLLRLTGGGAELVQNLKRVKLAIVNCDGVAQAA